ncbi:expressed unknown protein [Seminavis robusta]|uniref:Uncharacterized protein n=1 Tax=Seminavis robusta TaxID=568900 RepID=A0A9N8DWJ3_9STRA|nr:expressed unknown protein [Seminavis robusta]|eukprot:Sro405_g136280.1 n/a (77) ;mRNA; f:62262-62492
MTCLWGAAMACAIRTELSQKTRATLTRRWVQRSSNSNKKKQQPKNGNPAVARAASNMYAMESFPPQQYIFDAAKVF